VTRPPREVTGRQLAAAVAGLALAGGIVFGLGPYHDLAAAAPDGELLDTRPRACARTFLDALGAEGRARYGTVLAIDTAFTLAHGVCLWFLLRFPLQRLHRWLAPLAWLAAAATLLDLAENACIVWLLADAAAIDPALPMHLTNAKFAALMAAGATLGFAWLAWLTRLVWRTAAARRSRAVR
jgi:hypothetical protein